MASPKRVGIAKRGLFLFAMLLIPALTAVAEEGPAKLAAAEADLLAGRRAGSSGVEAVATYYAKRFDGRKTASGEIHRPDRMTAAHPDLPLGTRVKVMNLANAREVVVTVNDRCRRRRGEFIDLSRGAASELGILGKGRVKVRLVTLGREALQRPVVAEYGDPPPKFNGPRGETGPAPPDARTMVAESCPKR